ncbi:hypothetical protein CIW54_13945 [Paraburkholderia sp. T12-10]|nr:hypothetical protein CIW54_13945 [Paraburkholderia sp. T12-10]
MPCVHDLSFVRLVREPLPACASSASHAGGFAAGSPTGRTSSSAVVDGDAGEEIQGAAAREREGEPVIDFPIDVFECADAMPASGDVRIVAFRALLPAIRRVAIHAVEHAGNSSGNGAGPSACYAVYLVDCDGGEHPFLDFASAGSATYAALRIAQVYHLPVEFGSFAEPKSREA